MRGGAVIEDLKVVQISGVIRLTGSVRRDQQSDLAIAILARIDGVKAMHPDLSHR